MIFEVSWGYLQFRIEIFVSYSDINYQTNYVRLYNVLSVAIHNTRTVSCFVKDLFPVLVTVICQGWL
jgi:hypothetical protein